MAIRQLLRIARRFEWVLLTAWTIMLPACSDAPPELRKATTAAGTSLTAEELLSQIRSKYANAQSYSDNATLKQRGVNRSRGTITEMPFTHLSLLFVRPNRYAISYEDALPGSQGKTKYRVVSDGKRIRSSASQLPEQIHEAIAPRETTADNLIPEPELRSAIFQVALENLFPQLVMLLSRNTEKPIFARATQHNMLPDENIDTTPCYRLSLAEPEGTRVLWIDKETLLLKRMEIPIEGQRAALDPAHEYVSYSVDIDFENVSLDGEFAESATAMEVPAGGRLVRRFIPPPPEGPSEALGQPVKGYQFTDVAGEAVTASSLAGKIAVLDFWATDCAPCKQGTPILEQAYQQLKADDDVVFFGVSTDPKGLPTPNVEKTLKAWGATFPLLRDFDKNAFYALNVQATPTLLVIGPDNRLQASHLGPLANADDLVNKVRQLRDGKNLVELARQEHAEQLEEHAAILDAATLKTSLVAEPEPSAQITPRKLPEHLKVEELWSSESANLNAPGDVQAVIVRKAGPSEVKVDREKGYMGGMLNLEIKEIVVLDAGEAVVRFDSEGKFLGRVELPKHSESDDGFIRTTVDTDGTSWYLVSGIGWQQVFLYDENWKLKLAFPDEPHSGVGDARFVNFNNNGAPAVVVGYWGGRGVQVGNLEGQLQWTNRHLDHVLQVADHPIAKSPDHSLWCTSTRGTVLEIMPDGTSQRELPVIGHSLVALVMPVGQVGGNCGLSLLKPGQYALVEFADTGAVESSYELPSGEYPGLIPPILTIGQSAYDTYRVVAGPDGSLHFVDLHGKLVDRFDYGKPIAGLAAVPSAEGTILLISAGDSLTAWRITEDSAP
jgi:thiol-disulfide isomerase/thioredoxin/outer membrane lipoprotein-sorting protein